MFNIQNRMISEIKKLKILIVVESFVPSKSEWVGWEVAWWPVGCQEERWHDSVLGSSSPTSALKVPARTLPFLPSVQLEATWKYNFQGWEAFNIFLFKDLSNSRITLPICQSLPSRVTPSSGGWVCGKTSTKGLNYRKALLGSCRQGTQWWEEKGNKCTHISQWWMAGFITFLCHLVALRA